MFSGERAAFPAGGFVAGTSAGLSGHAAFMALETHKWSALRTSCNDGVPDVWKHRTHARPVSQPLSTSLPCDRLGIRRKRQRPGARAQFAAPSAGHGWMQSMATQAQDPLTTTSPIVAALIQPPKLSGPPRWGDTQRMQILRVTYNRKIQRAGVAGDVEGVVRALSELEGIADPNVFTLNTLLNAAIQCNCPEDILYGFWTRMTQVWKVEPNTISYNTLLKRFTNKTAAPASGGGAGPAAALLAREQAVSSAAGVVEHMKAHGVAPDAWTYNTLIHVCVKHGDIVRAEQVVLQMHQEGIRANDHTLSALLEGYGKLNQLDKAFACFDAMKKSGIRPNCVAYNTLANVCMNLNKPELALGVLRELVDGPDGPDGARADLFTYNVLLKVYREQTPRNVDAAFEVLERMEQEKVKPNAITFNTLVDLCCRDGRLEDALRGVELMNRAGVTPTATTYNPFIRGHLVRHPDDVEGAAAQVQRMRDAGVAVDAATTSLVVESWVRAGDPFRAVQDFLAMMRAEVPQTTVSMNGAVRALAECLFFTVNGQMDEQALQTAQDVLKVFPPPSWAVHGPERGRGPARPGPQLELLRAALAVFQDMAHRKGSPPDRLTYRTMVGVAGGAGALALAHKLFDKLKTLRPGADWYTYVTLARDSVCHGDPQGAVALAKEMVEQCPTYTGTALATLINMLATRKEVDAAERVFEAGGSCPPQEVWDAMLMVYISNRYTGKSLALFERMLEAKSSPPGPHLCNVLLDSLARARSLTAAMELVDHMYLRDIELAPGVTKTLVFALVEEHSLKDLIWLLEMLEERGVTLDQEVEQAAKAVLLRVGEQLKAQTSKLAAVIEQLAGLPLTEE